MHNYVRTDPTLYETQKFGFKVGTNRIETEFSRGLTNSAEYIDVIMYTCSHVYMYTCIDVYISICIDVYINGCIHV